MSEEIQLLREIRDEIRAMKQQIHEDNEEKIRVFLGKDKDKPQSQIKLMPAAMEEPPKLEVKQLTPADAERMMGPFGELFTYSEQGEYIILKPRQYLRNDFREILRVVREELKGEYVSAGKDSHFRIKR
jgi:hypothetical protein